MRVTVKRLVVAATIVLFPSLALAQGTLTGTVRDTSGDVLPGVIVEASSPVLIEKVRVAVTDSTGQYRIIDLNPGTYSLTFTLSGFSTFTSTGIVLAGTQVLTIPATLRVGALAESITVESETPVVDLQSVRREMVLDSEIVQAIPATRAVGSLLNLTPGLTVDNNGLLPTPTMTFFSARGGQANEGRMSVNGMTVAAAFNGGGVSSYIYDSVNADEVTVVVSGALGESDIGGPTMNIVPRAGGNSFNGQFFVNHAGDWSRGNNLNDALRAAGIVEPPGIISAYDASVSYGGPILRDRLWFFGSYRKLETATVVEGIVANANAGDLSQWYWAPDNDIKARQLQGRTMFIGRLTGQVSSKHRVSFNHEYQLRCEGSPLRVETEGCHSRESDWIGLGSAFQSPESATAGGYFDFPYYVTQAMWTAPMTSRLLLEAGYTRFAYWHAGGPGQPSPDGILDIGVTQLSTLNNPATGHPYAPRGNYTYRAMSQYLDNYGNPNNWRASASYVTGAHNMKVGYQGTYLVADTTRVSNPTLLSYTFNGANPTNFAFRLPEWQTRDITSTASFFIQDSWTRGRLTLQGALRYDRAWSWSPAEHNGTTQTSVVNASPITFGRTESVNAYNDVTPRFGVAYDVFGNGRTAIKFNLGHYLDAATNDSAYTRNNPAFRTVSMVTRSWTDTNGNRVVDCDLNNFAAQSAVDTCAALTGNNLNFGNTGSGLTQVNPETLHGSGVRENDWQWGVTVQQELVPRLSVEVGYARRWWRGYTVTDNTVRDPSQYESWTINAPVDSRLPNGGGYPITMWTPTAAAAAMPAQNYITFESDFGPERTHYWHGVDFTANARLRNGLRLQVGTSTGRVVVDRCDVQGKIDSPDLTGCLDVEPFQTTLRGLATYIVPRIDVLVSATFRSQPPLLMGATWNVPNTCDQNADPNCVSVQGLLGRIPPGGAANGTTAINLTRTGLAVADHRLYADNRRSQVDMRVAKVLRFKGTRADVGFDIGNLLNTNYATAYTGVYQFSQGNTAMGGPTWGNPTAVYAARFVRLNATLDF